MVSSIARDIRPADGDATPAATETVDAALYDATNRLVDSLLHDARNPLNALSINLEVLTEKLKDESGEVPPKQLKNLKAMREQVTRVDLILRQYADFFAPRGHGAEDFSAVLGRAVQLLGHEARVKRAQLTAEIDPDVRVSMTTATDLRLVCIQPILRALERVPEGGEIGVSLKRAGAIAFLTVTDTGAEGPEATPRGVAALDQVAQRNGLSVRLAGGELRISLPVV